MRKSAAEPSTALEESFPLLETMTSTTEQPADFRSGMGMGRDSAGDLVGATVAPDALTALIDGQTNRADDLTLIEGIGPKIASVLQAAGIDSFVTLSATHPSQISQLLEENGLGSHDPSTWPDQSQLAAAGEWDQLKEWQAVLQGGRTVNESEIAATSIETLTPAVPLEMDDLTKIEGIGPKIAEQLNIAGITSFAVLANTNPETICEILDAVGGFSAHDPATWPDQAQLAANGEWDKLSEWQDLLDGGRIVAEPDDLTKIEGIGPKIAELLNQSGITTYRELANSTPDKIMAILLPAGGIFATRDPATWSDQAQLAAAGEWDKLKEWQDQLEGGV
jgi:DNA-directed RNA polymerase subunit beta'